MALKKVITNSNGVQTEYHKVDTIHVAAINNNVCTVNVSVASYVNAERRQESTYNSVFNNTFFFNIPVDEVTTVDIFTLVYTKLKEEEMFVDAEDC